MTRVFISHFPFDSSRNDVAVIKDHLIEQLGQDNVFDSTGEGMFTTQERQAIVESCDVVIVVIGKYWVDMVDEKGNRLIEDVYDAVHVEIHEGIKAKKKMLTLVVDDVEIPTSDDLPEVLRPMLNKQTTRITDSSQIPSVLDDFMAALQTVNASVSVKPINDSQLIETLSNLRFYVSSAITYQQDDTPETVVSYLGEAYGHDNVTYRMELASKIDITSCNIMIVIVNEHWIDQIQQHKELVDEIESGIKASLEIIIFLVGIEMPVKDQLPESLYPLLSKQRFVIDTPNASKTNLDELIKIWNKRWNIQSKQIASLPVAPTAEISTYDPESDDIPLGIYISHTRSDKQNAIARNIKDYIKHWLMSPSIRINPTLLASTTHLSISERKELITSADVMIVMMGDDWLENLQHVNLEIQYALKAKLEIVVILIEDSTFPPVNHIPLSLRPLLAKTATQVDKSTIGKYLDTNIASWLKNFKDWRAERQALIQRQTVTSTGATRNTNNTNSTITNVPTATARRIQATARQRAIDSYRRDTSSSNDSDGCSNIVEGVGKLGCVVIIIILIVLDVILFEGFFTRIVFFLLELSDSDW